MEVAANNAMAPCFCWSLGIQAQLPHYASCLQEDLTMDINMFRERFGDVPQRGDLYLLCPLLEDPTDKASI